MLKDQRWQASVCRLVKRYVLLQSLQALASPHVPFNFAHFTMYEAYHHLVQSALSNCKCGCSLLQMLCAPPKRTLLVALLALEGVDVGPFVGLHLLLFLQQLRSSPACTQALAPLAICSKWMVEAECLSGLQVCTLLAY